MRYLDLGSTDVGCHHYFLNMAWTCWQQAGSHIGLALLALAFCDWLNADLIVRRRAISTWPDVMAGPSSRHWPPANAGGDSDCDTVNVARCYWPAKRAVNVDIWNTWHHSRSTATGSWIYIGWQVIHAAFFKSDSPCEFACDTPKAPWVGYG